MKSLINYFILILMFYGCKTQTNNILGIYIAENNSNTLDSLVLKNKGIYKRTIRRKEDNSLIFKNNGTWVYDGNRINLSDFLIDKDQIYKVRKSDSYFDDVLMTASLPVKKEIKKVVIVIDHKLDLYYINRKENK